MDSFFDAELWHGKFKTLRNNPTRTDGAVHEYCPPEHVDSELDNLLEWYNQYVQDTDRYHPLLAGAWLHHRFTQIHPFQDGNGRVVRALLTWHLVREGYLPVVVKRDDRVDYIDALEKADDGDLAPFVDLLVRMQRRTILEAIGEPERAETVDQVLDHIVEQIGRKNTARDARLRSVNAVAEELREQIRDWLNIQAERIASRLEQAGRNVETSVTNRRSRGKRTLVSRSGSADRQELRTLGKSQRIQVLRQTHANSGTDAPDIQASVRNLVTPCRAAVVRYHGLNRLRAH